MKKLATAIAVIALIGTPAFAADMAVKAPPPAPAPVPVYNWTGWYIGGNVGVGWADRDVTFAPNDPAASSFLTRTLPPPMSFNTEGAVGGAQFGYNWQFQPNWLVGFETDFDWSGMKGSSTVFITAIPPIAGLWTTDEHIKWFGTVRGRLGWLPLPNLLVYGTGGFAYANVERSANYTFTAPNFGIGFVGPFGFQCGLGAVNPCFAGSSHQTLTGWTAGGGLEYALTQQWSVRGEYLYVSLDNKPLTETASSFANGSTAPASFNAVFNHTNFNLVRFGLNYQFH